MPTQERHDDGGWRRCLRFGCAYFPHGVVCCRRRSPSASSLPPLSPLRRACEINLFRCWSHLCTDKYTHRHTVYIWLYVDVPRVRPCVFRPSVDARLYLCLFVSLSHLVGVVMMMAHVSICSVPCKGGRTAPSSGAGVLLYMSYTYIVVSK